MFCSCLSRNNCRGNRYHSFGISLRYPSVFLSNCGRVSTCIHFQRTRWLQYVDDFLCGSAYQEIAGILLKQNSYYRAHSSPQNVLNLSNDLLSHCRHSFHSFFFPFTISLFLLFYPYFLKPKIFNFTMKRVKLLI
jgi:hypothetical protein